MSYLGILLALFSISISGLLVSLIAYQIYTIVLGLIVRRRR